MALCLLVALIANIYAENYQIRDIGTLQTCSSEPIAINSKCQILGWYKLDIHQVRPQYFLRDEDGVLYDIPSYDENTPIDWKFLINNGKAFGTFKNASQHILFSWDKKNGIIRLANLPNGIIRAVNNSEQVLFNFYNLNEGKTLSCPAIWHTGNMSILDGLVGALGNCSKISIANDINDDGEVVGDCLVDIIHKNQISKEWHATKWENGEALDLHTKFKCLRSSAQGINSQGDILILFDNKKYALINEENNVLQDLEEPYELSSGYLINKNILLKNDGREVFNRLKENINLSKYPTSIIYDLIKIIDVNEQGQIVALGRTVYGENHGLLLTSLSSKRECDSKKNNNTKKKDSKIEEKKHDDISKSIETKKVEEFLFIYVNDVYNYYTSGIDSKVNKYFQEIYKTAGWPSKASESYRNVLMLEAYDNIFLNLQNIEEKYVNLKNKLYFWESARDILIKQNSEFEYYINSYIKMKIFSLNFFI